MCVGVYLGLGEGPAMPHAEAQASCAGLGQVSHWLKPLNMCMEADGARNIALVTGAEVTQIAALGARARVVVVVWRSGYKFGCGNHVKVDGASEGRIVDLPLR